MMFLALEAWVAANADHEAAAPPFWHAKLVPDLFTALSGILWSVCPMSYRQFGRSKTSHIPCPSIVSVSTLAGKPYADLSTGQVSLIKLSCLDYSGRLPDLPLASSCRSSNFHPSRGTACGLFHRVADASGDQRWLHCSDSSLRP